MEMTGLRWFKGSSLPPVLGHCFPGLPFLSRDGDITTRRKFVCRTSIGGQLAPRGFSGPYFHSGVAFGLRAGRTPQFLGFTSLAKRPATFRNKKMRVAWRIWEGLEALGLYEAGRDPCGPPGLLVAGFRGLRSLSAASLTAGSCCEEAMELRLTLLVLLLFGAVYFQTHADACTKEKPRLFCTGRSKSKAKLPQEAKLRFLTPTPLSSKPQHTTKAPKLKARTKSFQAKGSGGWVKS